MDKKAIQAACVPLLRRHGVVRAALFGSVVRNKQTGESDIDLLVEFEEGRSLLDLSGLRADLEELLTMRVNVVTYDSLHPLLKESILAEQEIIYESATAPLH